MNDILFTPLRLNELETLIQNSVEKAIIAQSLKPFSSLPDSKSHHLNGYLSIDQASQKTGYSKSTLYAKVHKRELPYYKFGKRNFFLESDIEELIRRGYRPTREEEVDNYLETTKKGGRK